MATRIYVQTRRRSAGERTVARERGRGWRQRCSRREDTRLGRFESDVRAVSRRVATGFDKRSGMTTEQVLALPGFGDCSTDANGAVYEDRRLAVRDDHPLDRQLSDPLE